MLYVIVRSDGKYVAPPGRESSYTSRLEEALVFNDHSRAQENCCPENERVVPVESLLECRT